LYLQALFITLPELDTGQRAAPSDWCGTLSLPCYQATFAAAWSIPRTC